MGGRSVGDHASIEVWVFHVTGNMCSASQYGELLGGGGYFVHFFQYHLWESCSTFSIIFSSVMEFEKKTNYFY